jgi:hypothetical protein
MKPEILNDYSSYKFPFLKDLFYFNGVLGVFLKISKGKISPKINPRVFSLNENST